MYSTTWPKRLDSVGCTCELAAGAMDARAGAEGIELRFWTYLGE